MTVPGALCSSGRYCVWIESTAIAAGSFFVYGMRLDDVGVLVSGNIGPLLAVITLAVCLGFLPYNFRPSHIMMGDSGALLLGLLMASSTIAVGGSTDTEYSGQSFFFFAPLFIPLVILGVPIIDTAFAIEDRVGVSLGPVVVNGCYLDGTVTEIPLEEWRRTVDVNLTAVFLACLATIISAPAHAQVTTIQIGTVRTYSGPYTPFYGYYPDWRGQFIYQAADINTAMADAGLPPGPAFLKSMSFLPYTWYGTSDVNYENFEIKARFLRFFDDRGVFVVLPLADGGAQVHFERPLRDIRHEPAGYGLKQVVGQVSRQHEQRRVYQPARVLASDKFIDRHTHQIWAQQSQNCVDQDEDQYHSQGQFVRLEIEEQAQHGPAKPGDIALIYDRRYHPTQPADTFDLVVALAGFVSHLVSIGFALLFMLYGLKLILKKKKDAAVEP